MFLTQKIITKKYFSIKSRRDVIFTIPSVFFVFTSLVYFRSFAHNAHNSFSSSFIIFKTKYENPQ